MDFSTWLLFVITFSSVLILPGPNSAFVVGQSLKYGFIGSLFVPLGFMSATGLHAILVFSGLGLVVIKYEVILSALKWFGVFYLMFLAYKAFMNKPSKIKVASKEISKLKMYLFSVFVSLTNPKALFASLMLYPLFLKQEQGFLEQAVIISLTAMVISFLIYSSYGVIAYALKNSLSSTKLANNVMGSIYMGAAGALASK